MAVTQLLLVRQVRDGDYLLPFFFCSSQKGGEIVWAWSLGSLMFALCTYLQWNVLVNLLLCAQLGI